MDNNFFYAAGTSEFDETSMFTNPNRIHDWFQSIGYTTFGDEKNELTVHGFLDNTANTAVYLPQATTAGQPSIVVGDGDNKLLQNLLTDSDVVGHQFGHHIIYATITRTSGESLVLHEGIADFFTFARTGNACLGQSICAERQRHLRHRLKVLAND